MDSVTSTDTNRSLSPWTTFELEVGISRRDWAELLNSDGRVAFWSFTSDGKNSSGTMADVTDIHPEAIGFEAQMPAGLARMAYWPDGGDGFLWAVEAKNNNGWKRFTEHHYQRA